MEPYKMTQKGWEVLWYFVQNTSDLAINRYGMKCGVKYPTPSGEERFYSYPSKIHDDFTESYCTYKNLTIAKDTAGKICKELCDLGILGSEPFLAARQSGKTPHYYLKEGYEPYLQVMQYYFEKITDPKEQRWQMNAYLKKHTDEGLVRYILNKKGVEMRRSIPLREWDAKEAPNVFREYFQAESRNSGSPPCSFAEYLQDQDQFTFPPTVSLRLPVFPDGLSQAERMAAIESLNGQIFERHPWLKRYNTGIREHYGRYEYERWILPILVLIRASPPALREFLFGDWEPYGLQPGSSYCFNQSGDSCMEYPLFRLLFEAIRDLAMVRDVEHDRFVRSVSFRPEHVRFPEGIKSALLKIDLEDWRTVYYDGSFDTEHHCYAISDSDVIEFPEETNYSFRSWVTIPAFSGGVFFSPDEFPAVVQFLQHLQKGRTSASRYIFELLSHAAQNVITTLGDEEVTADSRMGQVILRDLNEILLRNDLYKPDYFPNLKLTKLGEWKFNRDAPTYNNYYETYERENRELLERTFPGIMPKRIREEWETSEFFSDISSNTTE